MSIIKTIGKLAGAISSVNRNKFDSLDTSNMKSDIDDSLEEIDLDEDLEEIGLDEDVEEISLDEDVEERAERLSQILTGATVYGCDLSYINGRLDSIIINTSVCDLYINADESYLLMDAIWNTDAI